MIRLLAGLALLASLATPAFAQDPAIAWAYPGASDKMPFPKLPPTTQFQVKGSTLIYTGEQIDKMEDPVDWLPEDHPPPPAIVAHGAPDRKIEACGGCHGMDGQGFLSVPNLNGLPAAYLAEQLRDFAAGRRHTTPENWPEGMVMPDYAGKLSEGEIQEAAGYFSAIKKHPRLYKVMEADSAPRAYAHTYGWQQAMPEGGMEPLGRRIVLLAEDFNQLWIGDPFARAVAYAPRGALDRGKSLVAHAAQPCATCHGAGLKGMGDVPPLAGRNPHYLARQLWDIKTGARSGPSVALMQQTAAAFTADQIIDVTAYLASLDP